MAPWHNNGKIWTEDKLGNTKGWHEYLEIRGDSCIYHGWNDVLESEGNGMML